MTDEPEGLPRRQTDPVWLQDYYQMTGVSKDTASATATFVSRRWKPYVCTCRHVIKAVFDGKKIPGAKFPTMALKVGRSVLNLSRMTGGKAKLIFCSPKDREVDI